MTDERQRGARRGVRQYRACPSCGRYFAIGGWSRYYDYRDHTCVPRLAALLRRLGLLRRPEGEIHQGDAHE